jgi:hypothetical protein
VQPMLNHADRDRRQLRQLVPPRLYGIDQLRLGEDVRTGLAPLRPILDDLVDLLGREQPPVPALMPGLTAAPASRLLPARTRRRRRRILRRRQRRVPRTSIQPPLKLSHPSLEPLVRLNQLANPQQQRNRRLAITIQDRTGLNPLHTESFAAGTEVPSPRERLLFLVMERAGLEPATSGLQNFNPGGKGGSTPRSARPGTEAQPATSGSRRAHIMVCRRRQSATGREGRRARRVRAGASRLWDRGGASGRSASRGLPPSAR